jgi:hypothetical protein
VSTKKDFSGHSTSTQARTRLGAVAVISVAAVVGVGVALRFLTKSDLWLDEALSVNIAQLPIKEIPDALRQDGAPPLFYFLLHFWIKIFGLSDEAVRSFSGLLAVAALPLAYLAGNRLGGQRNQGRSLGLAALVVLASSPFAIRYATEARMYSLIIFLVFWAYLALRRALESPSLSRLAVVALVTALLLYTQYWSIYLLAVVGIGLIGAIIRSDAVNKNSLRRVLAAIVVGGIVFIPWLPTFFYQLGHTGTPWGEPQVPWSSFADVVIAFAGSETHAEAFLLVVPLLLLPLLGLFGKANGPYEVSLDLRTRPEVRPETVALFATLVLGLTVSWVGGTAFDGRYAAVAFPLMVLVVVFGLTVFASNRVRYGILILVVILGLWGSVRNVNEQRTQAAESAAVIRSESQPGDLVVYCPDQLGPAVSRLLTGVPVREFTFPRFDNPDLINWVDYRQRIDNTNIEEFAQTLVKKSKGKNIFLVDSSAYNYVFGRCSALGAELAKSASAELKQVPSAKVLEGQGVTVFRSL